MCVFGAGGAQPNQPSQASGEACPLTCEGWFGPAVSGRPERWCCGRWPWGVCAGQPRTGRAAGGARRQRKQQRQGGRRQRQRQRGGGGRAGGGGAQRHAGHDRGARWADGSRNLCYVCARQARRRSCFHRTCGRWSCASGRQVARKWHGKTWVWLRACVCVCTGADGAGAWSGGGDVGRGPHHLPEPGALALALRGAWRHFFYQDVEAHMNDLATRRCWSYSQLLLVWRLPLSCCSLSPEDALPAGPTWR